MKFNKYSFVFIMYFLLFQLLFELGILQEIIGYSDWQFYSRVVSGDASDYSFFGKFISLVPSSDFSIFIWYSVFLVNAYYLSCLYLHYKRFSRLSFLFFYNPFLILILSGVFKEAFFFFFYFSFFIFLKRIKLIFGFFVFFVRPHLYPLLLYIYAFKYKFILLILSIGIIQKFGFLDFSVLKGSLLELNEKGFSDLPIYPVFSFTDVYYISINFFIYFFHFFFSSSIFILISGFLNFLFILFLFYRNYTSYIIFVLFFNFYYLFFVATSGIAYRMMIFSTLLFLSYDYIRRLNSESKRN